MALQLWMPLMGDLRNQGLSNYSISTLGSISWVSGKLGALALKAGNGTQITNGVSINSNLTDILAEEYSVSVWVKPLGDHVHYNGTILSSGDWNKTRWAFGVNQTNSKVDILSNGHNTYLDCSVPVNEWTNLICTCDSTNRVYLYKNGELIGSSQRSDKPASDASTAAIGRETYASGYFSFNGVIQDLRLYNHCLSALEIKQLSQGLVLHYPLNHNGFGQENILINTNDLTQWIKESGVSITWDETEGMYKISDSHSGTQSRWGIYQNFTVTPNTTYTLTIEGKKGQKLTGVGIATFESTATWPSNIYTFTTEKTKKVYTFTSGSNHTIGRIYLYIIPGDTTTSDGWFLHPKLERGSIATPWGPNSSDTGATTLGFGPTEYDCSGFCNNGSKITDTITYNSDTAKYAVSTHFNGTYDGILIENLILKDVINSEVTYAFWIKPESESGARSVYFGSYNIGPSWSIEKTAGNVIRSYWNGSPDETCSGATITDGVWQHVCLTKKGTNDIKVYINGVQKWASTATHNDLNFPTTYRIGRDVRSNDGTPYKGLMSDFRIYATALSAADVKSLYQNCATIDPDGTIRGQIHS